MPIEIKQMTIQSHVTRHPTAHKEERNENGENGAHNEPISLHDGDQYQVMRGLFRRLEQERRER